jgi:hypothetical protein
MAQTAKRALDERLLTHHPAGQECLDVCHANGWHPTSGDVLRLVQLWDQVQQGHRSETTLSPTRLEFARWLYRQGKINEGAAA